MQRLLKGGLSTSNNSKQSNSSSAQSLEGSSHKSSAKASPKLFISTNHIVHKNATSTSALSSARGKEPSQFFIAPLTLYKSDLRYLFLPCQKNGALYLGPQNLVNGTTTRPSTTKHALSQPFLSAENHLGHNPREGGELYANFNSKQKVTYADASPLIQHQGHQLQQITTTNISNVSQHSYQVTPQPILRRKSSKLSGNMDQPQFLVDKDKLSQEDYALQQKSISLRTGTSELSSGIGLEAQSVTSKEQRATQQLSQNILTSATLQAADNSQTTYQVGLNMHSELSTKYNAEVKRSLEKCILVRKPDVSFEDIAGCKYAKDCINMSFVVAEKNPQLFKMGNVRPWQSVLLYGPPGVGKTMLTQAVAHHSAATCFWVSVSDITSKYIGESEQRLILLFELAIEHAPSIILIDEMDSLGRRRTGNESETERRIKTEFLRQMDQIRYNKEKVSVFATTNMPWELDIAALRRFERRILVPMPDQETRKQIIEMNAHEHHTLTTNDFNYLAMKTEGYSGSDLSTLVNDALMRPIKQLQQACFFERVSKSDLMESIELFKSTYMIYQEQEEQIMDNSCVNQRQLAENSTNPMTNSYCKNQKYPNCLGRTTTVSQYEEVKEQLEEDLSDSIQTQNSSLCGSCEDSLKSSYWLPVVLDGLTKSQQEKKLTQENVYKMELPQISQKNLLHRKANFEDFKACIDNPTVLPAFLELYVKFWQKYGHKDQSKCMNALIPQSAKHPAYSSIYS